MRNIGFHGGHTVYELGPVSDVVLFFECLNYFIVSKHPEQDWSLLTDRLYKRYLRQDELDPTLALMEQAKQIFAGVPSSAVEWNESMTGDSTKTWLNTELPMLADVFAKYFEHFARSVESAKSFFEDWKIYQPIKTVIVDMPCFIIDKKRPLVEYDALEGKPFWLL